MITNDMIHDEDFEGNYFSDDVAVKYDLQNGKINTVAFCICPKTAEDMAKSLNNGKKLTRSQEKLLGLKKIKIDRKDKLK